mmetsp:Transcript_9984/g.34989  ORF Transcript_9984/g.34989 Transcript_9984/m.34989 type:complete len:491 (+) Transcript_9984:131-1603(+)
MSPWYGLRPGTPRGSRAEALHRLGHFRHTRLRCRVRRRRAVRRSTAVRAARAARPTGNARLRRRACAVGGTVGVVRLNRLPHARPRVEREHVGGLAGSVTHRHRQVRLTVVAREHEAHRDASLGRHGCAVGLRVDLAHDLAALLHEDDALEERVRRAVDVDALHGDRGVAAARRAADLDVATQAELGHLHAQLPRQLRHDVVALGMDDEVGLVVQRRPLQVDDDEVAALAVAHLLGHVGGRRHRQGGAQAQAHVALSRVGKAEVDLALRQVLAEVDDAVVQLALAAWHLAHAPGRVLLAAARDAAAKVAQVHLAARAARLLVGVAVHLRDLLGREAAAQVQAVRVLAHEELEVALALQLHQRHVRDARDRLERRRGLRPRRARLLLRAKLPHPWARLQHGVHARAEVRDARARADAGAGERGEVVTLADPFREELHLGLSHLDRVEVLLGRRLGLVCRLGHVVLAVVGAAQLPLWRTRSKQGLPRISPAF